MPRLRPHFSATLANDQVFRAPVAFINWRRPILAILVCLAISLLTPLASAHPGFSAVALLRISADGRLDLTVRHDALAFALNDVSQHVPDQPMLALLNSPEAIQRDTLEESRQRFLSLTTISADARPLTLSLTEWPTFELVAEAKRPGRPPRLPIKLDFVAHAQFPIASRSLTLSFPEALGDVMVTVDCPAGEPVAFPVRAGSSGPTIDIAWAEVPAPHAPAVQHPVAAATVSPTPHVSALEVAARYVSLGFTHILPGGIDHVLFVLALFLLNPHAKALLWQITAFTIAHSLTLTLTSLHLLSLPNWLIEPVIAGSIAFVAIENMSTRKVHCWRPLIACVFGLFHGMGFASALSEVGLPTTTLATALISFNVGVELGHITVLLAAFLLVGWSRDRSWFRARVANPASLAIASVALLWTVQRIGLAG